VAVPASPTQFQIFRISKTTVLLAENKNAILKNNYEVTNFFTAWYTYHSFASTVPDGSSTTRKLFIIGLKLGAIFVWSVDVIAPYLSSVIYFTISLFLLRMRLSETDVRQQQAS
jgi:hypothetical protein